MRASLVGVFCALGLAATSGAVRAAGPEDLGLEFATSVKDGVEPALIFRPNVSIQEAEVIVTPAMEGPSAGAPQRFELGRLRAGGKRRLPLHHGDGRGAYHGSAVVTWGDGKKVEYTFDFDVVRYHTLKMTMAWQDIDLDRMIATCRASHEVSNIAAELVASDGRVLAKVTKAFDPPAPGGSDLTISWADEPPSEPPARLTIKVTDDLGVWASMTATPFTITIPHDEVEFALGSAEIGVTETAKLEKTLDQLKSALRQHGTLLDLKLFVAGFTDTVGPSAANMALSERRAAAIARWFRARGVRVAIYYQGFGEGALAVATPDETDEPRNRRALYILSVYPPLGVRVADTDAEATGGASWRKL